MSLGWVVPLGLLVGLVIGTLGGGGAIIAVPVLVYLFAQSPSAATTGSLIIVGVGAAAGLLSREMRAKVRLREGLAFALIGTLGATVGSLVSVQLHGAILLPLFGALLIIVAISMFARRELTGSAKPWPVVAVTALGVGFLTGFFGVGGGFAIVPALVLALGFEMREAVCTSLLVILINAAASLAARAVGGTTSVDWWLIVPFALSASAGTLLGGQLATRLPPARLRTTFAGLLLAVGAFVLLDSLGMIHR